MNQDSAEGKPILNGYSRRLRKYKYLQIEPPVASNPVLRAVFMVLIAFSIGLIVGFNIKDLLIRTCRVVATSGNVREDRSLETQAIEQPGFQTKSSVEKFVHLPEKFLINVPMEAPVNHFSLRPWRVHEAIKTYTRNEDRPYFVVSLVKSAVAFASRRLLIRQTWGSMVQIEERRLGVIFVIGMASSPLQQQFLEEENALYGDMVQGDFVDSYKNLPRKVLSGYQYVVEHLGNASEYYVSTDDDCFLNIPNTFEHLSHLDSTQSEAMHCGFLFDRKAKRVVNPRSKYQVSEDIYPIRPYPAFCHGGMTILPSNLLRDIYRVSLVTNYTGFHLEDVLTNGILREKLEPGGGNVRMVVLRDKKTRKKLGLMWHLGYKKDKPVAFNGLWNTMKRRLAVYEGPLDAERGYRANIAPFKTLKGRSSEETTAYFRRIENVKVARPFPLKQ